MTQTAARLLGEHLGADIVAYCRFETDEETFEITGHCKHHVNTASSK
jgi:hypothetical protein